MAGKAIDGKTMAGKTMAGKKVLKWNRSLVVGVTGFLAAVLTAAVGASAQDQNQNLQPRTRAQIQADLSRPITRLSVDTADDGGEKPEDYSVKLFTAATPEQMASHLTGVWMLREFSWEAPEYWHAPLYFDDVPLENYGLSYSLPRQVVHSAGRFYWTAVALPWKMIQQRPWECVSNLGTFRPGNCVASLRQRLLW